VIVAVWCLVIVVGLVVWAVERKPLTAHPRFKFNSIIPLLLNTGAVTVLGWCFVRRNTIGAHHRAHETWHHLRVLSLGRWMHLWRYLLAFLGGIRKHRLGKVTTASGRVYLAAYWWHPEEIAARAYADANPTLYPPLGVPRA
jgi:hypothetical protein